MAKLYYFCFFAAIGCLVPYLNVYFASLGLNGAEIGWLSSVAPLIALTSNPFWGAVADRWQIHRWVLACCGLVAGLVSLLFLVVKDFWPLLLVVVILSFFRTPIASLLDSTVLDLVRRIGSHYGRQRMWGSVGFVVANLGLARVVTLDNLQAAFWLHGLILSVVCTVLGLYLPIASRKGRVSLWGGLRQLVHRRSYVTFLGAMALLGIGTSSYVNFLGLHMLALGGDSSMIAAAWAANSITEFPMLFLGGRWFARFGYGRLIVAGFAGYALVWSLMAVAPTPILLLGCAALIGLCYGTLWAAAVNYASDAAPAGLNATAQALVGAAQAGVGWGIGSVLAGYVWDGYGGHAVYWSATVAALAGGALFWLGNRHELAMGIAHTERANSLQ